MVVDNLRRVRGSFLLIQIKFFPPNLPHYRKMSR